MDKFEKTMYGMNPVLSLIIFAAVVFFARSFLIVAGSYYLLRPAIKKWLFEPTIDPIIVEDD